MESCPLDVHALKKLRIHFAQPGGKMILFGSIDLFYRNDAKLKKNREYMRSQTALGKVAFEIKMLN